MNATARTTLTCVQAPVNDDGPEPGGVGWRSTMIPPRPSWVETLQPLPAPLPLSFCENDWLALDDEGKDGETLDDDEDTRVTLPRSTPAPTTWRCRIA